MKQLTVLTENKPGVLANIATLLGERGVNIESITAETFADAGVIRIITKDSETAKKVLMNAAYKVNESDILVFKIQDRAGELGKVARKLGEEKINIENIYLLSREQDSVLLALKLNDQARAKREFSKYVVER